MKKILIISYYWPPGGGGGVMRWLKMSKYILLKTDYRPIIFTPENAGYIIRDESLNSEVSTIQVVKHPIIEINNFLDLFGFKRLKKRVAAGGIGKSKSTKEGLKDRLILWIRSNLFIPDPRFLWVKPASRQVAKLIQKESISTLITTGPPHSMHLIGKRVKDKTGVNWIADFRDPWTFIDFFKDLNLSEWALRRHKEMEKEVIMNADKCVTVSWSWAEKFKELYGKSFEVITNGYDPEDFAEKVNVNEDKFIISHIGSLNKDRNSPIFWEAIADLCMDNKSFNDKVEIQLIGSVSEEVGEHLKRLNIEDKVLMKSHLAHNEVIYIIQSSYLQLLLINNTDNQQGIIPGKLYEYLATKRPIICIGNQKGDTARIINETSSGSVIDFEDIHSLKIKIEEHFIQYERGFFEPQESVGVEKYSREKLANDYISLIEDLYRKEI